jgi:large subunit ribosomal protein L15
MSLQLNTLKPACGSKRVRTRVGRGIGSGLGKTCGLGHKGQHARKGGYHKTGFEGGQTPLQRRIPKFGFKTRHAQYCAEVRLGDLAKVEGDIIDLASLRAANIITAGIKEVKIFLSGTLKKAVQIRGLRVSKGAQEAVKAAGGSIT